MTVSYSVQQSSYLRTNRRQSAQFRNNTGKVGALLQVKGARSVLLLACNIFQRKRQRHTRARTKNIHSILLHAFHTFNASVLTVLCRICLAILSRLFTFFATVFLFRVFGHIRRIRSRRPCATQKLIKTRHLDRCTTPVLTKTYK
jgi:hypothetical protein